MNVICQGCKAQVELPDIEAPKIVNLPGTSFIVIEHPQQVACSACGVMLVHGVMNAAQISIAGLPLPAQEQRSVIVAPSGMRLMKK